MTDQVKACFDRGYTLFTEQYWNQAIAEFQKALMLIARFQLHNGENADDDQDSCTFHMYIALASLHAGYVHDTFKHLELAMQSYAHMVAKIIKQPPQDVNEFQYMFLFHDLTTTSAQLLTKMQNPSVDAINRLSQGIDGLLKNFNTMRSMSHYGIRPPQHMDALRHAIEDARTRAAAQTYQKTDLNRFFFNNGEMRAVEPGYHYNLR